MRIDEIKTIAVQFARTNETIQTLCRELLSVHAINDRMAGEIAALVEENTRLQELTELPMVDAELIYEEPVTEINTQLYGLPDEVLF